MTNDCKIYRTWKYMRQRCYNQNNSSYHNYGGRGIEVCEEWHSFASFQEWALANGHDNKLSIDRIDNDGNYEPSNCRWATQSQQSCNTRRIHTTNKSGYRGVCWNTASKKWEVSIGVNRNTIKIGYYSDVLEAAKAYDSYVITNGLGHTINNVLEEGEIVESNVGQLLTATNTSGYVGVSAPKRISHLAKPFSSAISIGKKKVWSGYFHTALEGAIARDLHIIEEGLRNKRNFTDEELQTHIKDQT